MHTLAPLLPAHDRGRVEVFGYGYGRTDDSPFRRRAIAGCDRFTDLESISAVEAAQRIHADRLDVLVDLNGHTEHGRTEILALRPAPVQALWLGYPGTVGADCIDYMIGDAVFPPPEAEAAYSERPVRLPGPFLVLGREEPPPGVRFSRAGEGLPASGTVFCSFNNAVKLTPALFACWLRIVAGVPGSVLWLLAEDDVVEANLRRAAEQLGGDPARLVFARPVGYSLHLVRAGLADLALDTLGYNGGATTAALLWAGVPVLTAPGRHGPSRLSASLLRGAGLDELVAADAAAYEAMAIGLGRDGARLAGLKAKLLAERWSSPVFDAARLARHLEQAFRAMRDRFDSGLPPAAMEIG
jgi:predicted O-linked N-acetylglucosamine transferase (SPINDLY family)